MEENVQNALNDLLDIVEDLAKIVAETNPGANYGRIEFLIRRADDQIRGMRTPVSDAELPTADYVRGILAVTNGDLK
jgi:hypothetical protein